MVTGSLRATGSPVVPVEIAGRAYEAVVDTGFEGHLQLPVALLPVLQPTPAGQQTYQYADGRVEMVQLYNLPIELDGLRWDVQTVFGDSDEVVLGVDALKHFRFEVNFITGSVVLERVAPGP